ncbi:MAG: hypothetical protein HW421_2187 [Ignavibacteria bacterium]|nr:hypothetical protein [Ignavibacteria bacterium]
MRKIHLIIIFFISIAMTGCPVRSLQSIFKYQDLIYNPKLIGTWICNYKFDSTEVREVWSFQNEDSSHYHLKIIYLVKDSISGKFEYKDSVRFQASYGKIGTNYYLDIFPKPLDELCNLNNNMSFRNYFIPTHTIYKFSFENEYFKVKTLSSGWLIRAIEKGKIQIPHFIEGVDSKKDPNYKNMMAMSHDITLTATTTELQKFIKKIENEKDAYEDYEMVYVKEK